MGIADKLRSLPPREICEHGSQKVKCPICEAAAFEAALIEIAEGEVDAGGNRRNHPHATEIARKALDMK